MRLVFAGPAERDLANIIDHIAFNNPTAAERVYRAVVTTAARLAHFPEMGRSGRLSGTREFSVSSLPYLIVYEVGTDVVTILAVFHTSRDLGRAIAERRSQLNQ